MSIQDTPRPAPFAVLQPEEAQGGIDGRLRAMFRAVADAPAPELLLDTVDQLEAAYLKT